MNCNKQQVVFEFGSNPFPSLIVSRFLRLPERIDNFKSWNSREGEDIEYGRKELTPNNLGDKVRGQKVTKGDIWETKGDIWDTRETFGRQRRHLGDKGNIRRQRRDLTDKRDIWETKETWKTYGTFGSKRWKRDKGDIRRHFGAKGTPKRHLGAKRERGTKGT